jgi:hypothetical protein
VRFQLGSVAGEKMEIIMKNKFFALLLTVVAAFSFTSAANAQSHGHGGFVGGNRGGQVYTGGHGYVGGGHVGGYDHGYRGYERGYDHGYSRGYDRGYDYRGYDRGYRGYDRGYRGYNYGYGYRGFAYGFGLGYLLAPRYYEAPVYVAPAPELYVDQYGREYYLDADGYAVFTGRVIR